MNFCYETIAASQVPPLVHTTFSLVHQQTIKFETRYNYEYMNCDSLVK